MASGKTTIGPRLARRLGWDFCDMDPLIESRLGRSIAQVFAELGEPYFREQEALLAAELSTRTRLVVSAGGGAFVFPGTRRDLATGATTVWLRCAPATILLRLVGDGSRPLATTREKILRLMQEREPIYRQADLVVDTDACSPAQAVEEILQRLLARSHSTEDKRP
jgi:shikimate kinase